MLPPTACLLLALAPLALAPVAPGAPGAPGARSDDDLIAAWRKLPEGRRADVVLRLEAEARGLAGWQRAWIERALALEETDPGFLPVDEPAPFYDPQVHAPRKPIRRQRLKVGEPRAVRARERFLGADAARAERTAWRYDWGSGRVLRTASLEEPERTLRNALAGIPPDLDLAEALVARALDDGSQRTVLAAFDHAYTDRQGHVFPGVSLYDAWTSGEPMEMPDVDSLGIVHELLDDWKRWKSPVPTSKQDELYETVGQLLAPARAHRALVTALARTHLQGRPVLAGGYELQLDRLHALWAEQDSDVGALAATLPGARELPDFLEDAALRIEKDAGRIGAGAARREALEREAAELRALALSILREAGVGG